MSYKIMQKIQKISLFLLTGMVVMGLWIPSTQAALVITTASPSNISYSSVTLNGILNEGSLPITAWFELGTDTGTFNLSTSPQYYNSLANNFSTPVSGLNSNTTYYFRAVAESSQGRVYGNILSFTTSYHDLYTNNTDYNYSGTLPTIVTSPAVSINATSATLTGVVSGNNLPTTAWFEWGTNINFSNSTTQNLYGRNSQNYNITLTKLTPNTIYYFRAVAENAKGRVFGTTLSFTTSLATYINYPNTNYYPAQTYYPTQTISPNTSLTANTDPATNVASNSAQLNGMVTNQDTIPSNTYFEWGTNINLNNRTEIISTGAFPLVKHINKLNGLKPNTTYYFRLVAENGLARNVGATHYFTTNPGVVSTSTVQTTNETTTIDNSATITPVYSEQSIESTIGANVFNAGFLPGSLFGWLLLIIFILLIAVLIQQTLNPVIIRQEHQLEHH